MHLLEPYSGGLLALLAAPVLLLFYFLKLRRKPVRVSSTLLWDQAARDLEVNAPFKMIRPSWLLLLHLLVLSLLTIAAARPAIDNAGETADQIVILIDRSASMSALDATDGANTISRLERSQLDAIEILDRLEGRSRVMVVAYADVPSIVTPMTGDVSQARASVRSLEPSDQPGDLPRALRLIDTVSRSTGEADAAPVSVVVLSDGDTNASRDTGDPPVRLSAGTVRFIAPERSAAAPNTGIVAADASRDTQNPSLVRLFCRVISNEQGVAERPLTLRFNGAPAGTAVMRLVQSDDNPAISTAQHTFELDDGGAGGLAVLALSRADALASDNAFSLVIEPPVGPRVLLVRRDEPSTSVDFVLSDALAAPSLRVREFDAITIDEYNRRSAPTGDVLDGAVRSAPLASGDPADIVFFDRCAPDALPSCPSVSFAGGLPIPGLNLGAASTEPDRVAFFQRASSLTRYTDLGDLDLRTSRRLTLPEDAPGVEDLQALAVGRDGPIVASFTHDGIARVLISFSLADSPWWRRPGFPRFIKNCLDTLTETGAERAGVWRTTSDAIGFAPVGNASVITIDGPMNRSLDASPGTLSRAVLPLAGVYSVSGGEPERVAVNLASQRESEIAWRDSLDLPGGSIQSGDASNLAPKEIWHWFVIAASVMLLVEWLVYAQRMRL